MPEKEHASRASLKVAALCAKPGCSVKVVNQLTKQGGGRHARKRGVSEPESSTAHVTASTKACLRNLSRSSTHGGRGAEPEPLPWWARGGGRIAAGGRSMMDDGLELKTNKRPDLRRHRTRSLVHLALFRF
jgi:hypothetical protein